MDETGPESFSLPAKYTLTAAGAALLLAIGVFAGYRFYLDHQVNEAFAVIEREGYPVTLADLQTEYENRAKRNADSAYIESLHGIQSSGMGYVTRNLFRLSDPLAPEEAIPPRVAHALEEFALANHAVTKRLRQTPRKSVWRFGTLDLTDPFERGYFHLNFYRYTVVLPIADAVYRAQAGEDRAAYESAAASFQIADALASEPDLTSQRARYVTFLTILMGLERVVGAASIEAVPEKTVARLEDQLRQAADPRPLAESYAAVRAVATWYRDLDPERRSRFYRARSSSDGPGVNLSRVPNLPRLYEPLGLLDLDTRHFLDLTTRLIEIAAAPLPQWMDEYYGILTEIDRTPQHYLGSRAYLPRLPHIVLHHLAATTALRQARIAIAIERYRANNDCLPLTLDDLQNAFPEVDITDPLTGQPFVFETLPNGYVVLTDGARQWRFEGRYGVDTLSAGTFDPFLRKLNAPTSAYDGRNALYFRVVRHHDGAKSSDA